MSAYEGKKARLVVIEFAGPVPDAHCLVPGAPEGEILDSTFYENALALSVRSVLWAARRTERIKIAHAQLSTVASPDPTELPPDLDPIQAELMKSLGGSAELLEFSLDFNEKLNRNYELTTRVRYPTLGFGTSFTLTLEKGIRSTPVQIPIGPHAYVADFELSDRDITHDWYSIEGHKTGWPYFDSVRVTPSTIVNRATIAVTAAVPPHPVGSSAGTIWIRAQDSFGRVVAQERREFDASTGEPIVIRTDVQDLIAPGLLVETYAVSGKRTAFAASVAAQSAFSGAFVPVDIAEESPFLIAARVLGKSEWGMRGHYSKLRDAGVVVAVLNDAVAESVETLRWCGLLPVASVGNRGLKEIDLAELSARETHFAIWRALFEQSGGVELLGAELPQIPPLDEEQNSFSAARESIRMIASGLATLVSQAELDRRGAIRGEEEEFTPAEYDTKQSKFRGEWFEYRLGEAHILALLASTDSEKNRVRISRQEGSIFSPTHPLSVATTGRVDLELEPGEAAIVCRVPYEPSRLLIEVRDTAIAGSRLSLNLDVKTRDELPDLHVLHVTLQPKFGESIRYYSHTVTGAGGTGRSTIPLALNEAPGDYVVEVQDLLSGLMAQSNVKIVPQ